MEASEMIRDSKVANDESKMDHPKMDAGSAENLSDGSASRKKKRRKKNKKTKIETEALRSDQIKMDCNLEASEKIRDFKVANGELKRDHLETDISVQLVSDQPNMEAGSLENLSDGSANRKKKRRKKNKKKAGVENEGESKDQIKMDTGSTETRDQTDVILEKDLSVKLLYEQPKMDACLTENLSDGNANRKKKRRKNHKKTKVEDEVQSTDQIKMDTGSTENLAEGNVTGKRKRRRANLKKSIVKDETQTMPLTGPIPDLLLSDENHGKTIDSKLSVQLLSEQSKMVAGSTENLSDGSANRKKKKRKKNKKKTKIEDEVQCTDQIRMDRGSTETRDQMDDNLEASETIRDSKISNDESKRVLLQTDLSVQLLSEQSKMDTGSTENLSDGKKKRRKKNKKMANTQAEVESMNQIKMDTGSTETRDQKDGNLEASETIRDYKVPTDESKRELLETDLNEQLVSEQLKLEAVSPENLLNGNANIKKKKNKKNKKTKIEEEVQMDQIKVNTGSTKTRDGMDDNLKASEIMRDYEVPNDESKRDLLETDLSVQLLSEQPKMDVGSTEHLSDRSANREKKKRKKKKKIEIEDEVQSMDQIKMDTGSTRDEVQIMDDQIKVDTGSAENLAGENVTGKRKKKQKGTSKSIVKDEIQSTILAGSISNLCLSDENHGPTTDGKLSTEYADNLEASETIGDYKVANSESKQNLLETDLTVEPLAEHPKMDKGSTENLSEVNANGEKKKRPKKNKKKTKIEDEVKSGNQIEMVKEENGKFDDGLTEVDDEIILYRGKDSAEGSSVFSTCNGKDAECLYPEKALITSIRRKLIVLDLNGLLSDIVMGPVQRRGDTHILGRAVFRRPFYEDFLEFCFQNFEVAIWSSRNKRVIDKVVDYLLGDWQNKLLFCWDMSYATQTGFKTLENHHKPLVCKELRKIWENDGPKLRWKKGDYNESNTLLLDDSPFKALLNPMHTAIFPSSYHYWDKDDNSLGPGGDLRLYLEGLVTSDNVQNYVEQHPFGQRAITEKSDSWKFYSEVLDKMTKGSKDKTPHSILSSSQEIRSSCTRRV